ncbi:hypothetical protein P3S68_012202 [Capsicum galapagoense]
MDFVVRSWFSTTFPTELIQNLPGSILTDETDPNEPTSTRTGISEERKIMANSRYRSSGELGGRTMVDRLEVVTVETVEEAKAEGDGMLAGFSGGRRCDDGSAGN